MRLAPFVARIAQSCPDFAGRVASALATATPRAYPAALLLPLSERVVDGVLSGTARVYEAVFAVEIAHKHAGDADRGGPAATDLETLREQVLAALVGWDAGPGYGVVEHAGGELTDYQPGLAVWRDRFSVRFARD